MDNRTEALSEVIRKIKENKILLPDFQRNFVWTEEEKQAKLISSVLAKIPVGSILLLSSDSNDYAYKMIGCKERKTAADLGVQGNILALLDGQQRVTVLTNAFSNVVFEKAAAPANLSNQSALKRRFFLRIPKYKTDGDSVEDFFNARKLVLPWKDAEIDDPPFLADELYEAIRVVGFNAGGNDCYNPFRKPLAPKSDLVSYCSSGSEYLVPLFLLTGDNDAWLKNILDRISENIRIDILDEFDALPEEERLTFATNILTKDIQELAENPDHLSDREEFSKELKKQGSMWADGMKTYLVSCLNNIQLNQLILDNHNRARAINIYENLNKGGVALGTFELVLAKFASVSDENYEIKLINNMKTKHDYPINVYSSALKNNNELQEYINNSYNASISLGCIDQNEEMIPAYKEAYLDVISLYSHCPSFEISQLKIDLIKRDKILAVSAEDLRDKCEAVCNALDLALFFLQMRCGIRSFKEINYNLIVVVIAYLLLNPEYRNKEVVYDYLDAWYWSVMFSGYFNTDQTERAINSIIGLINLFNTDDRTWIRGLKRNVFNLSYFSEKEFLLLSKDDGTGIFPKEFLRDTICQFFMAETYHCLFFTASDEEAEEATADYDEGSEEATVDYDSRGVINPFCNYNLEKHHVIPLGSLKYPDATIKTGDEDKDLRNKKDYFLNSPVNFIYITDDENKLISADRLSEYANRINNSSTKETLVLNGDLDTDTEMNCRNVLSGRFDRIKAKVNIHIDRLIP